MWLGNVTLFSSGVADSSNKRLSSGDKVKTSLMLLALEMMDRSE